MSPPRPAPDRLAPDRLAPDRQQGGPGWAAGGDRQQAGWDGRAAGSARAPAGPPAGTWSPGREPHLVPQRQQPRRAGRRVLATILGVAVVAGLAFGGYRLLNRPVKTNSSLPPVVVTKTVPPSPAATALTPAGTVRAYFAAINARKYQRAWELNTVVHSNEDYQQFVQGLSGTAHDNVQIQSTAGNVVTAQLIATQRDGKVKTFQGTYTVTDGIISGTSVQQVS